MACNRPFPDYNPGTCEALPRYPPVPPSYGLREDLDRPARAHTGSTRAQQALETTHRGAPCPFPDCVNTQPHLVFQTNVKGDAEVDVEANVRSASLGLISILIIL